MDNPQQIISIPPLATYEQRLNWACGRRDVLPSVFDVVITREASFARDKRAYCQLCDTTMNGDAKTLSRHTESVRHMKKIAEFLNVTYTSLCPDEIYCELCGARFAGNRGDVLTRHLATHYLQAKESDLKGDLLEIPERGVPRRSNTRHTLTRRSKPPAKAEQQRKDATARPPLEFVISPLLSLPRPTNALAQDAIETAAGYDTTTSASENAMLSDGSDDDDNDKDDDDDMNAFFITPLTRSTTMSTSPPPLSPPMSLPLPLSPHSSPPLTPRIAIEEAADDVPDSRITLPPLEEILAGEFRLPPLSSIPARRMAGSVRLPPCSSFDQDKLRARIDPMPPLTVLKIFTLSKRDFIRAGD